MRRYALAVAALLFATFPLTAADPVVLEHVVSRHDPHFDVARARLSVGRDGNVYLANGGGTGGYVLRVSPDGRERFITAWSSGVIWITGFDGKPLWSVKLRPAGETPGGFDLDADGKLYVLAGGTDVKVFDIEGKPAGEVKLKVDPARKQGVH